MAGHHQRGSRVQQCDIAERAWIAVQHALQRDRVGRGIAALQRFRSCARQAGFVRRYIKGADVSVFQAGNESWASQGDLIETIGTVNHPGGFRTQILQHLCERLHPLPGWERGPSRLKRGGVASWPRCAPTFFIAGWCAGANMKPMPASRMQRPTSSGDRAIFTPSDDSTSAAPEREERARLPCLATVTPAPATMNEAQVETLTDPDPSPPVPTISTASAGAVTRSILPRIADTAPVISSTVSPRTRSAINRPPICEGVASPDITASKADAASSRDRAAPGATFAMIDLM